MSAPHDHQTQPGGTLVDPVCGMTVDAHDKPVHATFEGRAYSFCSERCRDTFLDSPTLYARKTA